MTYRSPRVSVGLAVYNGENFLGESLDSLLNQTYEDFELIISDNASTDKTAEICQEYAAKDTRIRYYRNERNLGASWNQNRVFELSTGEYYKLAAHDDLCTPDFLKHCVEVLDRHPDVVLCYPKTMIINAQGEVQTQYPDGKLIGNPRKQNSALRRLFQPIFGDGKLHLDAANPRIRFRDIACEIGKCHPIFGLIRTGAVKQTSGWENYGHADGVLLARLALMGKFYEVPEVLFFSREHPQQSSQLFRNTKKGGHDYQAYAAWWDPNNTGKISIQTWRIFSEFCKAASESQLNAYDKAWCYFAAFRWLRGNWRPLVNETIAAVSQLFHLTVRSRLKPNPPIVPND